MWNDLAYYSTTRNVLHNLNLNSQTVPSRAGYNTSIVNTFAKKNPGYINNALYDISPNTVAWSVVKSPVYVNIHGFENPTINSGPFYTKVANLNVSRDK